LTTRPSLSATTLAQYVRLESCDRYLWYRLHPEETNNLFREFRATEQPLTPLLTQKGAVHETGVTEELAEGGASIVDLSGQDVEAFVDQLRAGLTSSSIVIQARLEGRVGTMSATGIADIIVIEPGDAGGIRVTVGDAKASRNDRPEHRIQVAFYALLVRQLAERAGITIEEMRGCIWRVPQHDEDEQPVAFDLRAYEEAVELLADEEGAVSRIADGSREEARFHLTYKCDGCLYNALCTREAAERESVELVSFMSQRDRLALERHGVSDVTALATLKDLPAKGSNASALPVATGKETLVHALNTEWPLGANLDLHVQRARATAHNWFEDIERLTWIHRSGFGSMPSREAYPDLVQVFVDAHHDYVEDRVFLISGLVVGANDEREIIELAEAPPTEDAEGELVVRWVTRVLEAVRSVAGASEAILHVYVYDTYDQAVLLDAVRRHLDRLAELPDFFDLLTETAALSQAMFSFLAQDVRDQKNLGILCHSLPQVARRLGFNWHLDGVEYHRVFQARIFDNRRTLPNGRWYESAARFNSQIPLEYAYGSWGLLPGPEDATEERLLDQFRVSREQLVGFAHARLLALRHIEAAFKWKNKFVHKEPIPLPAAGQEAKSLSLADVLLEFLYIEHHAKIQGLLAYFAHPIERRVASGQTLLLEALEEAHGGSCRFRIRFDLAGLEPAPALQQMGAEEGDWMVLSEAKDGMRPWEVVRGRIAIIDAIDGDEIVLSLHTMSFKGSEFRFGHRSGMPASKGERYVLDPMADDLVAERLLDACRNTEHNEFLRWVEGGGKAIHSRSVSTEDQGAVADFATALESAEGILTPTQRQAQVIAEHQSDPILLVQGPPGTGKTHTLAWAILARAYAAARAGRTFHVLISAMTHTAVEVVLRSVVDKIAALDQDPATQHIAEAIDGICLFKEVSGTAADVPEGVTRIDRTELLACLQRDLSVVAAVPSGVHRLLQGISKPIAWDQELFDLLVLDEASQLNLPAAVLAGATLKKDGQAIVVGDHRQMPPIVSHDWKREPRRGTQETQIYASTFVALRDRAFPVVGLDQSFRLHSMHARFLEDHVYADDEVGFFSELERLLPATTKAVGHVQAALLPEYPVVVIEHAERLSLKRNDTEIAILQPIIEAARDELHLDPQEGLGVVVPHRAQRAALKELFPDLAAAGAIDTVERFQGGERDLVVVSATASDPEFVLAAARFLLNPNRLNVALSRSRKKLIVIGSTTIFRLVPPDMEIFESALLWKRLRYEFSADVLWEGEIEGIPVRVSGRRVPASEGAIEVSA
jgi:hypothetical protein